MATTVLSPTNRRIYLIFELDQAIECLGAALERISEGRMVLRADAATLFLLSNGLERYLKVALHVLHHEKQGDFAGRKTMKNEYGHDILKLGEHVFALEDAAARTTLRGREDLAFARNDDLLTKLLTCLDAFAGQQRYFLLDGVSGFPIDPELSPSALWEEVLTGASGGVNSLFMDVAKAQKKVAERLTYAVQRYLRCIAQAVHHSTDNSQYLSAGMMKFLLLGDDELSRLTRR